MDSRTERLVCWVKDGRMWIGIGLWLVFSLWFFGAGPYATMTEQGGVPDEDFWQAPEDVTARVDGMSNDVRSDYQAFLAADLLFAALYGFAAFAIVARACRVIVRKRRFWLVAWTPLIGASADVLENLSMFVVMAGQSAWPFVVFQSIKAIFTSAAMILAVLGALGLLVRGIWNPVRRG